MNFDGFDGSGSVAEDVQNRDGISLADDVANRDGLVLTNLPIKPDDISFAVRETVVGDGAILIMSEK